MNLVDGTLVYPRLSVAEFIAESATWSIGMHGVICDDAETAYDDLALSLIEYNALLGRSLSVYNYDSDQMDYYQVDPEVFPFHFDKIHREQWRRWAVFLGKDAHPDTNVQYRINMWGLKSLHEEASSYAVGFLTLPEEISEVDAYASQIAYNYTYDGLIQFEDLNRGKKNMNMKRTSNVYYIYDQATSFFYRFQ